MTWTVIAWPYTGSAATSGWSCLKATSADGVNVVLYPGMWSFENPATWETNGYSVVIDDRFSLSISASRNQTGLTAINTSKIQVDNILANYSASRVSVVALPK